MSIIEGLLIFCTIVISYFLLVILLKKIGLLEKYNISFYGPALLLRTEKGKKFIKKISRKKRFWKAYGSFGVAFCFITMILMVTILIWQAWAVLGFSAEEKASIPGPEVALVLPGINPILPLEFLGYILLGLVVAIIVHEFSHGILTLAGNLKVKSLGILYFIFPIGAFCEPDEEQLKNTSTIKRMRVYAAGPLSNFVVVLVSILLFSFVFMSAVQPTDGANVISIYDNTPADEIGLSAGMVITSINDTAVNDIFDFQDAMNLTKPEQTVNISYFKSEKIYNDKVQLTNYYDFAIKHVRKGEEDKVNKSYKNDSFLGVKLNTYNTNVFLSSCKNPFTYKVPFGFLMLYILPLFGAFEGYNPIVAPFTDSYTITGPLGAIPSEIFWIIVNALYWIFWLNLAVGLFNVLPMIPLDGGFLFNDAIGSIISKLRKGISDENKEKIVKNITLVISLLILFSIIFPFLIKYI